MSDDLSPRSSRYLLLVSASPEFNSLVSGPDVPIQLHFNSRIDLIRSRLILLGADGTQRELRIRGGNSANELVADANGLEDGFYALEWLVHVSDGHVTRGQLEFRVGSAD